MTELADVRAHRRRSAALLAAIALLLPWSLSAIAATPSPESLKVARDYVDAARYVELLDAIVNRFAAGANIAVEPNDLAMKRRVVRDISREVMADSLARSLADTPIQALRDGLAYARSDAGRIEFACVARMSDGGDGYPSCLKDSADEAQLARIMEHSQSPSGLALMGKALRGETVARALNDSTRELVSRDPEIAAQLADYCKRKPDEGMCGYQADAASEGGSDERR
ncbi:MAG: hypothetical protein HOQ32_09675 [Lysobacter sp.]|nr:hypothetical protein [Lysobacter sp.]